MTERRNATFPCGGYSRVSVGEAIILVDRAAVGPDYLPGHAHADTLSFELSLFGQRVIVNSGTSVYGTGPERQRQRGTTAHSTVVIDNQDSSEVWGGFRVARRARVLQKQTSRENGIILLSACHDGYRRLKGKPKHHRSWHLADGSLVIYDRVTGNGNHSVELVLPLHPNIAVEFDDAYHITLYVKNQSIQVRFEGKGDLRIEKSSYHPEFGLSIENQKLLYRVIGQLPIELITKIDW